MVGKILGIASLLLLSSVKFAFAPGIILTSGYNFVETLLISTLGGFIGIFVFYYFGDFIVGKYNDWRAKSKRPKKQKKTFSRKNKLIVKTKITYGLVGLALITPILLSIPLGSLLAARFFRQNKRTIPVLCASVVFWSLIMTTLFSMGILKPDR